MIIAIEVMTMLQSGLGWMDAEFGRERHRTLLREAEIDRTMRRLRGEDASNQRRIGERLGDVLIALGCRLKRVPASRALPTTSRDRSLSSANGEGLS